VAQKAFLRLVENNREDGEVILESAGLAVAVARNLAEDHAKSAFSA